MDSASDAIDATEERSLVTGGGMKVGEESLGAGMAGTVCAETALRKAPHARTSRPARRNIPMNRRCLVRWAVAGTAVRDTGAKSVVGKGLLR